MCAGGVCLRGCGLRTAGCYVGKKEKPVSHNAANSQSTRQEASLVFRDEGTRYLGNVDLNTKYSVCRYGRKHVACCPESRVRATMNMRLQRTNIRGPQAVSVRLKREHHLSFGYGRLLFPAFKGVEVCGAKPIFGARGVLQEQVFEEPHCSFPG